MKSRRGQVTLFVILGICILFLIGTAIYIWSQKTEDAWGIGLREALSKDEPPRIIARTIGSTLKSQLIQEKNLLNPLIPLFAHFPSTYSELSEKPTCAEETKPPESIEEEPNFEEYPHTLIGDQYIYYFNIGGVENIPTPEQLSRMIEQKIKNDLPGILSQVSPELLQNYNILTDQVQIHVLLTSDRLRTRLAIPICAVGQPPQTETLQIPFKTNLLPMLEFARWIVQQDIQHPEYLDLSGLDEEAERRNFKISLIEEKGVRAYTLVDMDPDTDQTFATLAFASLFSP
ncbi:MAG: hypothetical protein AABX70_03060 [Nanoarchaeota archaeon]